jgi:hypothetical protein
MDRDDTFGVRRRRALKKMSGGLLNAMLQYAASSIDRRSALGPWVSPALARAPADFGWRPSLRDIESSRS